MKTISFISILLFLCFSLISISIASEALPLANENGDYAKRTAHLYWIVVDTDPSGLNGRLSPDFPSDWENPTIGWPKMNIGQWPVVKRFAKGTILNGCMGNCGVLHYDVNNKPWLMVSVGIKHICFVRANSKYIKPVRISTE